MSTRQSAYAPDTVSLIVCPVCGRTDRFTTLRREGKHYTSGKLCHGAPVVVTYRKARSTERP